MLRISTSSEAGDMQPLEGRSPSQSPANSQDHEDGGDARPHHPNVEERLGAAGIDEITAAASAALQQSMIFDRDTEDSMNHSTASASLASPTRLEKLRTNHEMSATNMQNGEKMGLSSPMSPGNKSTTSSRPDDERSVAEEPLCGKRLFVQEETEGVEIHQPFSYDDGESIGELAQFLTPQDEEEDDYGHDAEYSSNRQQLGNDGATMPQHEKILFEERITQLHQQLAAVEAERDALLNKDHQQIQDMYQDPYASPMKQDISAVSGNSPDFAPQTQPFNIKPTSSPTSKLYSQEQVDELHKQVVELQAHMDELKRKLHSSEQSKKRLKMAIKSVETQDKQKSDLLETLSRELGESTARESTLRAELDSCRVKLEGFEMAQAHLLRLNEGDGDEDLRRSPSDVATALVVSEKHNQALQAHLDELQSQNQSYRKRIAELEKEILPKGDKEKQLYSRYVEMKASLSSLAGVLEEVNGQNQMLNARVVQLESEMEGKTPASESVAVPTPDESDKLQTRVHELEEQVENLLETEKMHNIRCRELEAAIESLESSSSDKSRVDSALTPVPTDIEKEELQGRVKELESIVQNLSQVEQSYKEQIQVLEQSNSRLRLVGSNPSEQGVEMAATSSEESTSYGQNLGVSSSGTATAESTAERILESSSSAWTSEGSSDDSLTHHDPISRELQACKTELEVERQQVSNLSRELHLSKSREAEFKNAVEKLTTKLQSVNSDRKRVKLRAELDALKDAMEVAAQESNQLLGEMENLLTATQQELRNEQSKSKDLEMELGNLRDQQQQLKLDSWDQSPFGEEHSADDTNEIEYLKRMNRALKKEVSALKSASAKRYSELEAVLAQTRQELALEQQKVAVMSREAANRRNLEERLESTRNELNSFNILDILSPNISSLGTPSQELIDLRLKNKALESENASLKTELQRELNLIKQKVISINSQEMEKEREDSQLVRELQEQNSVLQRGLDCVQVPSAGGQAVDESVSLLKEQNVILQRQLDKTKREMASSTLDASKLKAQLEETKNMLVAEQQQVQKLSGSLISLQMEVDSRLESMEASHKDAILLKEKEKEDLNVQIAALHMEVKAFKLDVKRANELAADREEEAKIAHLDLVEERKRNAELNANIASLRNENRSLDDMAVESSTLRSELCNLKGDIEIANQEMSDLQDQKRKLEDTLMAVQKDLASKREEIAQAEQFNMSLQAEVDVLKNSVRTSTDEATYQKVELSASLASSQKELESERQKLQELKNANSALQKAVDALQRNLDSLNAQADKAASEKIQVEQEFKSLQSNLNQELAVLRQEIESLKIANDALERDSANMKEESTNATALLKKTKEEMAELESEVAVSKLKVSNLTFEKEDLQDQLDSCKSDLKQTKSVLQSTEDLKSELEAQLEETKVVLAAECQKAEGLAAEKLSLQTHQKALELDIANAVALKDKTAAELDNVIENLNAEQQKSKELKEALESANHEIDSLTEKLKATVEEKLGAENELSETHAKLATKQEELQNVLHAKMKLQSALAETESSLDATSHRLADLDHSLRSTKEALDHEKNRGQELSAARTSLEQARDELERDLNSSTDRVVKLEATLVETRESLQAHQVKVEELTIEGISLRAELNSLKSHVETTNARASMVTDHKTELENLLSTTKNMLEFERQKVQELHSSNDSLRSEMEASRIEMGTLEARFKQISDERSLVESELKQVKQSLSEEKAATKHLTAELSNLQCAHEDLEGCLEGANSRANLMATHKDELETVLQTTKELLEAETKKVEDLDGLKTSLETQLKKCQAELDELKGEMESAFSRANFASKKKEELEVALAAIEGERQQATKRNREVNSTNSVLRSELETLRADFENASKQAVEIKETYEALLTEAKSELLKANKELDLQKIRVADHEKANDDLQAKYNSLKADHDREYSKIVQMKEKLGAKLQDSKEKVRLERQRVEELKQKNGDLETDLNKLASDLKKATEKATIAEGDLGSQIASSQWELIAEQQKVEELTASNKSMESELSRLRERLANGDSDIKERCDDLERELESTQKRLIEANETIANLKQEVKSLGSKLEEGEAFRQNLNEKVDEAYAEIEATKKEAETRHGELEMLLLATKEDLLKEQQKVEDYSKLESSMQFEMDTLKEAMHRTVTTDREKALASLREELNAEKEKVGELTKSKLSLQSKLRVLQQASDSKKANAFVQERETEVMLASTKKDLEAAIQTNEELKAEIHKLESTHSASLTAAEKEFSEKLQDYAEMEQDLNRIEDELKKSEQRNLELTKEIASLESDVAKLKEENWSHVRSLDEKEKALLELASIQEELRNERKRSECLASDKQALETQLRVAKHAAESANANAGVRVWETEMIMSNTKKDLEESLSKNAALTERISTLECSMKEMEASHSEKLREANQQYAQSKAELAQALETIKEKAERVDSLEAQASSLSKEKENLLERTATLARRDQIQKASLATSEGEINALQKNVQNFEERFQFLSQQLIDSQSLNSCLESEKENINRKFERSKSEWASERSGLQERISSLERDVQNSRDALESVRIECNNVQSRETELRTNFDSCREELKTLKSLKERWNSERNMLTQRIHDLTNDLQEGAEAVDVARRESITSAQQMLEEQQSQWSVERDSLKERISSLERELKSTREELRACKEDIISREKQIEDLQTSYQAKVASMEEEMLDSRVALQNSEQNLKESASKQSDLKSKLESKTAELQENQKQMSSDKSRIQELEAVIAEKEKDIQSLMEQLEHHEERVQDLQIEKDRLSEELASNLRQAVKNSEHERSLKKVESDLDEAQIREGILESMLSDCKKELNVCKEELELCKKEVFDEKYCNGVYKELISKLNRANDSLEQKNKKLAEEIGTLKKSGAIERSLESVTSHDRSLTDENAFLRNQKEKFAAEISSMDGQLRSLVTERDTLKATAVALQEKVDSLQEANDELQEMVEKLETLQEEGAKEQNERLEAELAKSQKALAEVSNKAKGMRHKLSQEIEAAKAREATLIKEIDTLKASNEAMVKRLEEQEKELDEFEQDFAMARDDARKVVEELRGQVQQLERRNQQLTGDNTVQKVDELKNKLRQLISQNQRLQKEMEGFKSREKKLQRELGLGGWK